MYNHEIENTIENQTETNLNLVDFLRKFTLRKFVTENPKLSNFPYVMEEVLVKTLNYPEIEKAELTGSMARFAAGFGSMERYWQGKDGAGELLKQLSDESSNHESDQLKSIVANLSNSDLDMDLCFRFKDSSSLLDLYSYLNKSFSSAPKYNREEKTVEIKNKIFIIKSFSVGLGDNYQMGVVYEPILSNPRFNKITIGFSSFSQNISKNIIHIDMSEFPKTGIEGREQKRHGGRSVGSQDKCRLVLENKGEKVVYKMTDSAKYALYGQETVGTYGKTMAGVAELALRALRIRLIHTPNDLPIKMNYFAPSFDFKSIFLLRKSAQEYVLENKKQLSFKEIVLPLKDLVLCFNYDPYITLQFLQDSGLYLLFPDLRNLSENKWRNLYLNDWLNLTTEGDRFIASEKRSLTSLIKDQTEYKRRGLKDGFTSTLRAINETKNLKKEFNLEESFKSFISGESTKINKERVAKSPPTKAIFLIMHAFKGGLTEVEIHRIYNSIYPSKLYKNSFRGELRKLKLNSRVDKQLRKIQVRGTDRSVTLYHLRIARLQTPCDGLESLLNGYKDKSQHPYINRAKEYLNGSFENSNNITENLVTIFDSLKIFGVKSLETLRSLSPNDFTDSYNGNLAKELSLEEYQIGCRTLQIISEDILKNPQFYKSFSKLK